MLSIDATALVIFALVWVLVIILTRVFFKPLSRILDKRQAQLNRDREEAARALEAYERELQRVEEALKQAKAEAAALREKAEVEALREKSRMTAELQAESRAQLEKAREDLRRQVEQLKRELDGRVAEIAAEIEKRMLD
jgi:F-type H+-transporting ATPase subunit b